MVTTRTDIVKLRAQIFLLLLNVGLRTHIDPFFKLIETLIKVRKNSIKVKTLLKGKYLVQNFTNNMNFNYYFLLATEKLKQILN